MRGSSSAASLSTVHSIGTSSTSLQSERVDFVLDARENELTLTLRRQPSRCAAVRELTPCRYIRYIRGARADPLPHYRRYRRYTRCESRPPALPLPRATVTYRYRELTPCTAVHPPPRMLDPRALSTAT